MELFYRLKKDGMKRIYTLIKAISVMLLVVLLFTACTKSTATPDDPTGTTDLMPGNKVVNISANSTNIGSIAFSKEADGNARVVLRVTARALEGYEAPYRAMLKSATLPTASLQAIDSKTGESVTYPVISSNKGLAASYDALMFMRDLQLIIYDGGNRTIAVADVQ
jgi:hypothetical protein